MSGKISGDSNATPGSGAYVPVVDPDLSPETARNIRATRPKVLEWLGRVDQAEVAAGNTLAVTYADHQGWTVILAGAGASISFDANTEGAGFAVKIINDTGAAWTVPSFGDGVTNRPDTTGHTKISAGGSGALEVYSRGGDLYVHVTGTTEA